MKQIQEILPSLKTSKSIISVFAGRIFDIGINATPLLKEMAVYINQNSNCYLLWASPRMHYDFVLAENAGCDIITMPPEMYKKMGLIGKSPDQYSLETVKMFFKDAEDSGFNI